MLDLLRAAASPVGVQEITGQAGLHPNTARFHLDALVDAGLAARAPRKRRSRAGPAWHTFAVEGSGLPGRRHCPLLAEMLTSLIAA